MSNTVAKPEFWEEKNHSFITADAQCDLLHPELKKTNPSPSLTETQYFGFSVPEENIHALMYMWHHPNLGVVTGGAWVWRGLKTHVLQSELFSWSNYMSEDVLVKDLWDYQFENGYHVTTIEPLKKHRLRYADAARQNFFDVEVEAIMAPMVHANGLHMEQAVKTRGELTLRGKTYQIKGHHVRDRSWGADRCEKHSSAPPMDWMTGVFNENFAFSCTAFDHPDTDPEWKGILQVPGGDTTKGGWVLRDGRLIPIVSTVKRGGHDFSTLRPTGVEMTMTDADGRVYALKGEITVANRFGVWPTMDSWICLTRWECEGQVCRGDLQQVQWHDYIQRFLGHVDQRLPKSS